MQASGAHCNTNSAGGLSQDWGFQSHVYPLFERAQGVISREHIIKDSLRTCSCTTGCKSARCGCRRRSPSALFFLCNCKKNCENRGTRADHVNVAAVAAHDSFVSDDNGETLKLQDEMGDSGDESLDGDEADDVDDEPESDTDSLRG